MHIILLDILKMRCKFLKTTCYFWQNYVELVMGLI